MRRPKIVWVLLLALGLIASTGNSSPVLASPSVSHYTHFFSEKGPLLPHNEEGCYECHADGHEQCQGGNPVFADGHFFLNTAVCGPCHSPGGAFDGVGAPEPDNPGYVPFGAKGNWDEGVYEPGGGSLKAGKEQWCATCHDEDPPLVPIETDDFQGYDSHEALQNEWEIGMDTRLLQLVVPDESTKYMEAILKWTRTTEDYGVVKRTFDSPIALEDMDHVNYYVKIDDPSKFDRVKVRLVDSNNESCGANFYASMLVPGEWKQVWLSRSMFNGEDTFNWNEVSQVQFRIFENGPSEDHEESVYIDNVSFTKVDPLLGGGGPNVVGDNQTFGYYITGHGRNSINQMCEDCHDPAMKHIDGEHRTYCATADYGENPEQSYRNGYRLNEDMAIPRGPGDVGSGAFKLCTNEFCHLYSEIVSDESNFRDDLSAEQWHAKHLDDILIDKFWDSDWDAVPGDPDNYLPPHMGGSVDSAPSCPACHNVHGSPTPAMTRHGELISTPGTTDKVPGLDFMWLKEDLTDASDDLSLSRYGRLIAGPVLQPMDNNICTDCHRHDAEWIDDGGTERYYRLPSILEVTDVWTSNLSDEAKDDFLRGEDIRYHVSFKVLGSEPQTVKTAENTKAESTSGTYWKTDLSYPETLLAPGDHEWSWDEAIPDSAGPGSTARVVMRIKLKFDPSGAIIREGVHEFNIVE